MIRLIELIGVRCAEIGGKRLWNILVSSASCGGGFPGVPSGFFGTGVEKLFMTRSGGARYSFPGDFGFRRALRTSLHSE